MSESHTAVALVATTAPDRYAKQLASHLGRRCEVVRTGTDIRIVTASGDCQLRSAGDVLEMTATAATGEHLRTVTHLVGSHLERFGQRNELAVHWRFDTPTT